MNATIFDDVTIYEDQRGKRARMLKLVREHLLRAKWAKPHTRALSGRTDAYVSAKAVWIQSLIRGYFGRREYPNDPRMALRDRRDVCEYLVYYKIYTAGCRNALLNYSSESYMCVRGGCVPA